MSTRKLSRNFSRFRSHFLDYGYFELLVLSNHEFAIVVKYIFDRPTLRLKRAQREDPKTRYNIEGSLER